MQQKVVLSNVEPPVKSCDQIDNLKEIFKL